MQTSNLMKAILFFGLLLTITTARAQWVAIPDTNFGIWLNDEYSSCMSGNSTAGWQLDTICAAANTDTAMNIYGPQDMTGIQYFKHVTYLQINSGWLSYIPAFPPSLKSFICTGDLYLTNLPVLPDSLSYLDCSQCNIAGTFPALPSTMTYLDCSSNPRITGLPTLPAHLNILYCYGDSIASIPALPSSLTQLDCHGDSLTSLPALPASLTVLNCGFNKLNILPAIPVLLNSLYCNNNNFASLPSLPVNLNDLDYSYNPISSQPLLPNLNTLVCAGTGLDSMPTLPLRLITLDCSFNHLTSLPALPGSLSSLTCSHNQLDSLPTLPDYSNLPHYQGLQILDCSYNQFTSLPILPRSLQFLYCNNNQLTSLPALSASITRLYCNNNPNLSCLPPILSNGGLDLFYIGGTNITCLPNLFQINISDMWPNQLPLCTPSSGCEFYYNIAGNVHFDTAATCSQDSLQPGMIINNVKMLLMKNGQILQQFYTCSGGEYTFKTDSLTGYEVVMDAPFLINCPASGNRYVVLSPSDSVEINQNFGLTCASEDYAVAGMYSRFRPGYTSWLEIGAGNLAQMQYDVTCGVGEPGIVTVVLSGPVSYVGPATGALTPSSVSGNMITYTISDLNTLRSGSLNILVATDSTAIIDTSQVCITAIITPSTPDANPNDDTLTQCFIVGNSYDPNLKEVYPIATVDTGSQWLTYTITFQNTGTDTALTIVVKDTLSAHVDASSFQYIASSGKPVIQLFGNVEVFTFAKANLPDSMTNPSGSVGWIQYKVKTQRNLPVGIQIANSASVYFDLNPAVVTNTTINTVRIDTSAAPTGLRTLQAELTMRLYPNPNSGTFTLETSQAAGSEYAISDMLGQIITRGGVTGGRQKVDLSDAPEGVYTFMLHTIGGVKVLKFTITR